MNVILSEWPVKPNGENVILFRVENEDGTYIELCNWGARWISAFFPDYSGKLENLLVGYENINDYIDDTCYMGATIGRVANRISNSRIELNSKVYQLDENDGKNSNHGGFNGFNTQLWEYEVLSDGVRFFRVSFDNEGGFPGNVTVSVKYRLHNHTVIISYYATTDFDTYINLTNHAYLNISGKKCSIKNQDLRINADKILGSDQEFIPTGDIIDVKGSVFDFRHTQTIGKYFENDNIQLKWNRGYNNYFILNKQKENEIPAAYLRDQISKRTLTIYTDALGLFLYTAGFLRNPHIAVCLETQNYPDSCRHRHFPSCLLRSGETYVTETYYVFDVEI